MADAITAAAPVVEPAAPSAKVEPISPKTDNKAISPVADKIEDIDPVKTPVAKQKIKWGDTEKEVSFDEAVKLAEKAFGIEEKARVASKQAADAQAILDMVHNNPKEFAKRCKAAGVDPQKLATEILYEQIELNTLTPEQRELREYKEKEAEAAALRKETEDAAVKADIDQKTQAWAQKFEKELQSALEAKKLPMSRLTLALAAQYIDAGLAQKKELSVEQVLPFVMRDLKNIHSSTMGTLDGDALLDYIGDELSNKIAAARVARYKKGQAAPVVPVQKASASAEAKTDLSKLKGKAYWKALRMQKSEEGVGVFPGQE